MIFVEVVKNDMCQPMIGLHRLYMGTSLVLGDSNRLTTWHMQVVAKYVSLDFLERFRFGILYNDLFSFAVSLGWFH